MSHLCTALYVIVGLINIAPGFGVISATRLDGLYDISLVDPNLILLMRHRALLLAIVGGIVLYAGFFPAARPIALVAGFCSMLSFILLVGTSAGANAALGRVMWIDVVAVVLFAIAWVIDWNAGGLTGGS